MAARNSISRTFAFLIFAVVGCGEVSPPPQVSVDVDPTTLQVDSGGTGQLSAWVRTNTDASVTWTSSDESIATVERGIVRGVNLGEAMITAASTADPSARDSALILVRRPIGFIDGCQAVIAIRSVTVAATGAPVQRDSVFGTVMVRVDNETCPEVANTLQVLLDETIVMEVESPRGQRVPQTATVSINTAERNAIGNLRFSNGPHTISARIASETGVVRANSSTALTFKN